MAGFRNIPLNAPVDGLSQVHSMSRLQPLSRRQVLRGLGVTIALPALEAMAPARSLAASQGSAAPIRMAFAYLPNGIIMDHWTPEKTGKDFELPRTLQPLNAFKNDLQVLSGLDHTKANSNGDGGGDHARANATFLTGMQAKKTAGSDIRIGVSVDQLAAQQLQGKTRHASLELGCDASRKAGRCDSGYSCAYQFNFSWKTESLPMPPEHDPRVVFEKLFGSGVLGDSKKNREQRIKYNKSILDFVTEDAKSLQRKLGYNDKEKLDEYLTGVREIERQIEHSEKFRQQLPNVDAPTGVPDDFKSHIRLLYDLIATAYQTDTTRIATFLVAHDGSNRSFNHVGVNEGHHYLSHHREDQAKKDKLAKIDRFYVEQFAYFLGKLESLKEGEGSVLDNSMIILGGGHSDGNRHQHTDLPVVLAGGGGGKLQTGRHVDFKGQPMTNLYLSMLDRMDIKGIDRIGDSTGRLQNI